VLFRSAAATRHIEEWKAFMEGNGSLFDIGEKSSGMHHLKHALTDIAFLLEMTATEELAREKIIER